MAASGTSVQTVTLTPPSTELSIVPGGNADNSFDVINSGDTTYNLSVSAAPYYVEGVNYDPQFTLLPGRTDASQWVHITSSLNQTLASHKLVTISYTLRVPASTAPGGYYAVLFAETNPATTDNGVVIHNRVGDILYITVQGPVRSGGSLQGDSLPRVTTAASLPLSLLVSNTGGAHFMTSADLTVKNIYGKSVFHANLQRYVLPQTIRKISAVWDSGSPIGLYRIERSATVASAVHSLPEQWILVIQPWVLVLLGLLVVVFLANRIFKPMLKLKARKKS